MNPVLFWLGALVVVSLLTPVLKLLIAAVGGKAIGQNALDNQPDQIHLQSAGPQAWKNAGAARQASEAFAARGFEDAGVYGVAEMPGLVVQLMAHPGDCFYAAIYEHPKAGHWFDVVTRYQDGTSVTFSTARPTALKPRPGHPVANLPGSTPVHVIDKALAQRPNRVLMPSSVHKAVTTFERAYAESIAYRKQAGISTGEVVGTALRKVA
jgi:hypothetical protein